MFLFVTGGTASGKSEYAEEQAEALAYEAALQASAAGDAEAAADKAKIIYAATMSDRSSDSLERIKRHQLRRERAASKIHRNGVKNAAERADSEKSVDGNKKDEIKKEINIKYETFECYTLDDAKRLAEYAAGRIVLFDCLSGFAANVMFGQPDDASGDPHQPPRPSKEQVAAALADTAAALSCRCSSLVLVSDLIFSDGCSYDRDTLDYIDALAAASRTAAAAADSVVEVVCGIPVRIK